MSSPFGKRVLPGLPIAGSFHPGIDLPAPVGAAVFAVAAGTIVRIQRHGPGGLEVLIQHDGFTGIYSHLGSVAPAIASGRRTVRAGEKLGRVGRTGVSFGPHLYFGMIVDGKPADPAPLLGLKPCREGV